MVSLVLPGSWVETGAFEGRGALTFSGIQLAQDVSWTPVAVSRGPTLGYGPMTFDAADGYALLYETDIVSSVPVSPCGHQELWKFVHGEWTELPSTSAPKFDTALLTYDPTDNDVVLFGGCGTESNQTWTYAGGVWQNVTTPVAPPAREAASLAYDPSTKGVVLFGGYVYFNLTVGAGFQSNDTWEFQHGVWHNITSRLAPPARDLDGMASDTFDNEVLLFGGEGGLIRTVTGGECCLPLSDTWTFANGLWSNASSSFGPSARTMPALADDPAGQAVVLFGGEKAPVAPEGSPLNDTWGFSAGRWQNLTIGGNPPARAGADLVYDPLDGSLVLFGGEGFNGPLNDTWVVNASLVVASSPSSGPSGTTLFYAGILAVGVALGAIVVAVWRGARAPKPPMVGRST